MLRLLALLCALFVCAPAEAARIELTGAAIFYVSTSGNDANDGLSAATPKRTTNAMVQTLQRDYDFKCFDVQIQHAASSVAYTPVLVRGAFAGSCGLSLRLTCSSVARGACTINAVVSDAVYVSGGDANVLVEDFSLQAAAGTALHATLGSIIYYRDIEFLAATYHIAAEKLARTFYLSCRQDGCDSPTVGAGKSNYFISGSATNHLYVNAGATSFLTETTNSNGIQIMGMSVTFQIFANVIQGGNLTAHTNAWTGTVNSYPALYVRWNSFGGIAGQLPGNQSLNNVDTSSTLIP